MPFRFLKYVQPTRYFLVPRNNGAYIYPELRQLPEEVRGLLQRNSNFTSEKAQEYDLSWQAIHAGYIGPAATYSKFEKVPVQDEYAFVKMYFHPIWLLYIFIIRVASFKNPLNEINGLLKSKKVQRVNHRALVLPNSRVLEFESSLVAKAPKVSVIIPTLNRYTYLTDVLNDLQAQDYSNFEVIVVDQSDDFSEAFYTKFNLDLKLIHQKEKALWLARNTAIRASTGEYLLFFDDDSRVDPDWIKQHLRGLDYFNADASSGVSLAAKDATIPGHYTYFRVADQLDTGNALIKKNVFKRLGLYDRQFEKQRMGDGEFGMRMYCNGYNNISNPLASRVHLKVPTGGLRQMGSWDAFRTKKLFAPRPIPSVLYFFRRYFGDKQARLALLKSVPPSIIPYRFKKNKVLLLLGIFVSMFLIPVLMIQLYVSWRRASKKINQGPRISEFN